MQLTAAPSGSILVALQKGTGLQCARSIHPNTRNIIRESGCEMAYQRLTCGELLEFIEQRMRMYNK